MLRQRLTGSSTRSREALSAEDRCLSFGRAFWFGFAHGCILLLWLLTVIFSAARVRAQDNYEIQVYGSELVDPGHTWLNSIATLKSTAPRRLWTVFIPRITPSMRPSRSPTDSMTGSSAAFTSSLRLPTARAGSGWALTSGRVLPSPQNGTGRLV